MKKIISILITISMLLASVPAFAISGTGTESNPYLISSASDIVKIHDDLNGYYKLTNNINMSGVAFEPIGNENEGAFTGTIDGAGYTISNLNINLPDNKYVGFVGYLEGTIKNLNLTNVDTCGYRYVGGLVGYSEENSSIDTCTVQGIITGDFYIGDLIIGGIVGMCKGTLYNCINYSKLSPNVNGGLAYVGGISGINYNSIYECINDGVISIDTAFNRNYNYLSGISGYNYGTINNCTNNGDINISFESSLSSGEIYIGGVAAKSQGQISNSCNLGKITTYTTGIHTSPIYIGGISGYNLSPILMCSNDGQIQTNIPYVYNHMPRYIGGIAGYNISANIKHCINNAMIYCSAQRSESLVGGITGYNGEGNIDFCSNSGFVFSEVTGFDNIFSYSGGIAGNNYGNIGNCNNSGRISSSVYGTGTAGSDGNASVGGICARNYKNIYCCVNIGYAHPAIAGSLHWPSTNQGGIYGYTSGNVTCCYEAKETIKNYNKDSIMFSAIKSKEVSDFDMLDFDNVWKFDDKTEDNFPILQNTPLNIRIDRHIVSLELNQGYKLNVFDEDVVWSSDDNSIAVITSSGYVIGVKNGICTITATNSKGMKANCLVYVYNKANTFSLNTTSTTLAVGETKTISYTQNPTTANEVIIWDSSDKNIATVDLSGNVVAKKKGTTTITATTANSNLSASCEVNVTGAAITNLSLSLTSAIMNVNTTKTLTTTISPSEYAGSIIWNSSNEYIATVDQSGTITAIAPGTTIISITSDTGKTAQCTITVKAPATSIKLNKNEVTLEVGYTERLTASMLPVDSTDTVSWSSSSTSYVTVTSDGTVTAKNAGTATLTATTTSGQKAYCVVKVVNPVVPVASVTLDKTEHIMTKSETIQLKGTVLPSDATNKDLSWSTSDDSVASVNDNGVVTANSVGVATITATTNNGMYHECIIKVVSASGPSIVLTPENAIPNAISKVKASIVRNPGISGYKFTINYDDTLLTPVSVTANEDFGGTITTNLNDANRTEFNVVWYSNGDTDIDINGELFTIDFKVTETAELGDYSDISIEYGAKDICNTAGENIALYTESAKVTVEEPLAGDIYEDGDVNIYDLTLLARHMIGLADFTDRQLEAANVTDDDLVDIKDVVKLAQYVVGWTGVELMSLMSLNADVPKTPTVTVGTASVNDANEADIPVYIKNNTGVAAYRFVLDYNVDDIEIVSITPSDFINSENFGTNLGQENDEGLIVFCYQEGNAVTDSELFTIKVRYKNPTDTSISPISIKFAENNFCNQAIENVAANYETGYALGDDYIVANKVVGDTNFSCELYFDDSYEEQSAKAIIAFYDGDGRMVQLMPKDITVKPGKVDLCVDYEKKAYSTYKLMIWEGMGNLKPVTEVK